MIAFIKRLFAKTPPNPDADLEALLEIPSIDAKFVEYDRSAFEDPTDKGGSSWPHRDDHKYESVDDALLEGVITPDEHQVMIFDLLEEDIFENM